MVQNDVPKSPRVAEQCDVNIQSINPKEYGKSERREEEYALQRSFLPFLSFPLPLRASTFPSQGILIKFEIASLPPPSSNRHCPPLRLAEKGGMEREVSSAY
ncbi:hypothetical protein TNCV_3941061 [Trichonephila clavipes]|uniref:Uncharacterized protein n=1 Tax=Trichonephila clavipes TaxID=2585209 RepID=A0A8X6VVZ0_TRICX|nr:hypothetical protein TNCV_3941061 [Trichonephila clavipes]